MSVRLRSGRALEVQGADTGNNCWVIDILPLLEMLAFFLFNFTFHKRGFGLSVSEYLPSPLAMRNPNCSALKVKCQILGIGILRIEFQHHLTVEKVLVLCCWFGLEPVSVYL